MTRPIAAGVVTALGGFFILVGGAVLALVGDLLAAVFGSVSGLFFLGVVLGSLTIVRGVLMLAVPGGHSIWGILAIVFGFGSIPFALGGFIAGFVLTLVGGVLALHWRPPPPERIVTVTARVLPPDAP